MGSHFVWLQCGNTPRLLYVFFQELVVRLIEAIVERKVFIAAVILAFFFLKGRKTVLLKTDVLA